MAWDGAVVVRAPLPGLLDRQRASEAARVQGWSGPCCVMFGRLASGGSRLVLSLRRRGIDLSKSLLFCLGLALDSDSGSSSLDR